MAKATEAKQREKEIAGRECRGTEDKALGCAATQNCSTVILLSRFEGGGLAHCRRGLFKEVALLRV
jgi:hypothetical protein